MYAGLQKNKCDLTIAVCYKSVDESGGGNDNNNGLTGVAKEMRRRLAVFLSWRGVDKACVFCADYSIVQQLQRVLGDAATYFFIILMCFPLQLVQRKRRNEK